MLTAFQNSGSFYKGNLHGHSTNSDGQVTPERYCSFYADAGYDFVCLSDHFLKEYDWPITDTSAFRAENFTTIIGAEIHTDVMDNGAIWHLLSVGLPFEFERPTENESAHSLAQRAIDAGAFVALAHPEWNGLTLADAMKMPEGIHAVEVFNTIAKVHTGRASGEYLLDQLLTKGRRVGAIAVDDVHYYHRDGLGGWVMVKAQSNTPDALLNALKQGDYYASTGPEIHHIERRGDYLHVETSPVQSMFLLGGASKSVEVLGEGITRARLPLEQFAGEYARLTIETADGLRAWTNPIWS